jgi:hypothetical protein
MKIQPEQPDTILEKKLLKKEILRVVKTLNQREEKLISLKFGLNCKEHSHKEIANIYNLGEKYTQKLINNILNKLKHTSRSKNLIHYTSQKEHPQPDLTYLLTIQGSTNRNGKLNLSNEERLFLKESQHPLALEFRNAYALYRKQPNDSLCFVLLSDIIKSLEQHKIFQTVKRETI